MAEQFQMIINNLSERSVGFTIDAKGFAPVIGDLPRQLHRKTARFFVSS